MEKFIASYEDLFDKYKKLAGEYQTLMETLTELASYNKSLIEEIKYSNPDLSLRMMNKIGDIMFRNAESLRNNK